MPAWATPRARIEDPVEAAFMAGSALNALDNLVQAEPEWSGAWRHRLALKAASASMTLIGRTEDEAALRDAWLLRQPGDAPGPAGNVLAAWRRLAGRSLPPGVEELQAVVALLGVGWHDGLGDLIDVTRDEVRSGAPAPAIAARAAAAVMRADPKAVIFSWWLADCALSWRMGWLEQAEVRRIRRLLQDAGLPVVPPAEISPERFLELMAVDKKVQAGQLRLVLLKSLGDAVVTAGYPMDLLQKTLVAGTGLGEL